MTHTEEPVLVRRAPSGGYATEPGMHSHNQLRQLQMPTSRPMWLRAALTVLVIAGLAGIGYYGYTLADQYIYQAYQNWSFDQQIAGRPDTAFADYVREQTPFGFLMGKKMPVSKPIPPAPSTSSSTPRPSEGSLLGRIEISRLNLSAIVREGVGAQTLRQAVGHVPTTTLAGQSGNFAIAAHRDTLFRALKDIQIGDEITFQSATGSYTYQVAATKIVLPSDVSVLQPNGGGLIPVSGQQGGEKLLTMITCYPFYYVGAAPKRFIVEAKLVSGDTNAALSSSTVQVPVRAAGASSKDHAVKSGVRLQPRAAEGHQFNAWPRSTPTRTKKRNFWHRIF